MTYRVRNLVIAIGLALVAMLLTLFYVTNYKRSVQHSQADVRVYVATRDLDPGVSGAQLVKQGAFKPLDVARRSAVAGAIAAPEDVDKLVLSEKIYAGEQVTIRRFSDVAAQGVRAQLKGTMRAVQVPGDSNQLLVGTLKAGDHVDVIGAVKPDPNKDAAYVRISLRDVPVLQAPSLTEAAKVAPNSNASVILGVTDVQVQRLYYLMVSGDWTLQLRPVTDATDTRRERVENPETMIFQGLQQAEMDRLARGGR